MDSTVTTVRYLELSRLLTDELNMDGYWTGELATSALSTSVAIVALKVADNLDDREKITAGYNWLCRNINPDGGFGDTVNSVSNASTTLLCYAAIRFCQDDEKGPVLLNKMEEWLSVKGITFNPATITRSILKFYGKDYTFSIPILSMLVICGVIPSSSLKKIPVLPFELTLLPSSVYRFFNLRVVSYALPALIGVGIYLHKHRGQRIKALGSYRNLFIGPAINKLNSLVPSSGGFLEAIPLTGFVLMCLLASGLKDNKTVKEGIRFLRSQQREDGGWPIDTDLSTWVTTLSIKALGPEIRRVLSEDKAGKLRDHIIGLQFKTTHPFNGAKPGGWGWTSYTGSVPDADDTPGAILGLLELFSETGEEVSAIENGCRWLIDIQNTDGGFPTFCKGWGRLPFDRSCADLTGHALLALLKTEENLAGLLPAELLSKIDRSIIKATDYLIKSQSEDGSWLPLWFGNQHTEDTSNPVYGTAKVCIYLTDCLGFKRPDPAIILSLSAMVRSAQEYLLTQQNFDGSWGGKKEVPGSIEETSLAICALGNNNYDSCLRGFEWIENQGNLNPSPIGLYFAMLWYDEKLYPLIYYLEALRRFNM